MKLASKNPIQLNKEICLAKLSSVHQEHLLNHWETLTDAQQQTLIQEIEDLDLHLVHRLKNFSEKFLKSPLESFTDYLLFGNAEFERLGKEIVRQGKAALVVLAGGQGSRLRYNGPKGCFPITSIRHKSLFQLLAEKVKAASAQSGVSLQVAFMTSPSNRIETENFFKKHHNFGLEADQVSFFDQKMWPLLNFEGDLFLESPNQIALGPNGNGALFQSFVDSGMWEKWAEKGIEMVNVVPIDNALAAPFDFQLFGAHASSKTEITAKTTLKQSPEEKVGILARCENKIVVREYSELSEEEKWSTGNEGNLKFNIANLSLFAFSMSFIYQMSQQELVLHRAKKAVKILNPQGEIVLPESPNAWKFETFIFDALPFTDKFTVLLYPRPCTFAPLKNLYGEDSISQVRKALLDFDRNVYREVTGIEPPHVLFELAPQFYYPTPDLLNKWKGKPLPEEDYVNG